MRLGFSPITAGILDVDVAWRLADELRLDFVELSADLHEALPALQTPERIRALQRATGIGASVHGSYVDLNLASAMPLARANAVERTLRGIDFAASVAAIALIVHSGRTTLSHPIADDLAHAAQRASFAALPRGGTPIAIENLALDPLDLLRGPEALRALCDEHDLLSCFDVGHAFVEGGEAAIGSYLDALEGRIHHLHLHDNRGIHDDHEPFGVGTIPYGAFVARLAATNAAATLEIAHGEAAVRAAVARWRELLEGAR
jgi:sugar phosphate isomerase/epimerase